MEPAFLAMAIASGLHVVEEYLYPGGFLRWLRSVFPQAAPGSVGAIAINGAFFCLVLSPLFSTAQRSPIFSLSIAGLLLANGALHVVGTLVTRHYSPGTVTSVLCYFPASIYSLLTIAPKCIWEFHKLLVQSHLESCGSSYRWELWRAVLGDSPMRSDLL